MIHEFLIDITRQQGTIRDRESERERDPPRTPPVGRGGSAKVLSNFLSWQRADNVFGAGSSSSRRSLPRCCLSHMGKPKWATQNTHTPTHKHTHKRLNALSAGPGWLAGYPSTTDYFGLICHISASVQNQNSIYAQTQAHTHAGRQTRPLQTYAQIHTHIKSHIHAPLSKPGQVLPPAVEPAFSNQELIVIPRCGCRSRFIHNYQ